MISLYIDFDNNKGFFRKNGEKCLELNLNPASLGFYPCIGMHSTGEAVQIMEKAFWEPEGTSVVSFESLENKLLYLPCLNVGLGHWLILSLPRKDPLELIHVTYTHYLMSHIPFPNHFTPTTCM